MLALDDPGWRDLQHAYGSAIDTPRVLLTLRRDPELAEAWEHVWGALCHQGSASQAAFAAAPHIVAIAEELPLKKRLHCVLFVGAVTASFEQPAVPSALRVSFRRAAARASGWAVEFLVLGGLETYEAVHLLSTVAAFHGCVRASRVVIGFADRELRTECAECDAHDSVRLDECAWDESLLPPSAARGWCWTDEEAPLLLAALAHDAGEAPLAAEIRCLHRVQRTCPRCGHRYGLYARLLEMQRNDV